MYWKTPDIQQVNAVNAFIKEKSNYGFVYEAFGKKYSELTEFAIEYYDKQSNPKYFGQISTFLNFMGFIELDDDEKILRNELLTKLYENKQENDINDYMNYFLCRWQFPTPNLSHDRDAYKVKPYLIIIKILLLLQEQDESEAYLTNKDFYLLFDNPCVHSCTEINKEFILNIIKNRSKQVDIGSKTLKRRTLYYKGLLLESYLLTDTIYNSELDDDVMIALKSGKKVKKLALYLINKYQDNFFNFDANAASNDKKILTKWAQHVNNINDFNEWRHNYMIINDVEDFMKFCLDKGFYYSEDLIRRFILSLEAKPFLIITGISGSGKSKIAELWSEYKDLDRKKSLNIAVGSNWKDNKKLLGFKNILQEDGKNYVDTELVKLIEEANKNPMETYMILFDEMNLSHVEHYFSDFLSALESRSHEITLPNNKKIVWSQNIKIIGTVNVDETTYMFSPKVLDRANVIEMNGTSPDIYIKSILNEESKPYHKIKDQKWFDKYIELLNKIYEALNKNFAYRVIDEITIYIKLNTELFGNDEFNKYFDEQIYQKILPKLHGSKTLLKPQLEILKVILSEKNESEEFLYINSLNKINEMLVDIEQGYASFNRR